MEKMAKDVIASFPRAHNYRQKCQDKKLLKVMSDSEARRQKEVNEWKTQKATTGTARHKEK